MASENVRTMLEHKISQNLRLFHELPKVRFLFILFVSAFSEYAYENKKIA